MTAAEIAAYNAGSRAARSGVTPDRAVPPPGLAYWFWRGWTDTTTEGTP